MVQARPLHVSIVGATGAVGVELVQLLESTRLPLASLTLLGSGRKSGRHMDFDGESIPVTDASTYDFSKCDIAFFSAGGDVSRALAPAAVEAGAMVIDNSSAFRMDETVPLVIPEVNAQDLPTEVQAGIVANPNCSTIIALVALEPIRHRFGIQRMVISTYQAASGGGAAMMEGLRQQTQAFLDGEPAPPDAIGRPYAFNCFSHNAPVGDDGFNEEETKLRRETCKIWHTPNLPITATCVRVPVLRAHAESIVVQLEEAATLDEVRHCYTDAPGVTVRDDRAANAFPEPIHVTGEFDVHVGRLRMDATQDDGRGLCMFVCGDQLLKGAALNALQIAEAAAGVQLTGHGLHQTGGLQRR